MRQAVHKTMLSARDPNELELPFGSQILFAREQGDTVCIWFLCDTEEKRTEKRRLWAFGTGHEVPALDLKYLGSAHLTNGLVFHVFEEKTQRDTP